MAVDAASTLLAELVARAEASDALLSVVRQDGKADVEELEVAIASAEERHVDEAVVQQGRDLKALLEKRAREEARRLEQLKREAEAGAEREKREARRGQIEAKRRVSMSEVVRKKEEERLKESEEDHALLVAAGGALPASFKASATAAPALPKRAIANPRQSVSESAAAGAAGAGAAPAAAAPTEGQVDKSGWMLKTGPESPFFAPKWSQRYFVLVGGTLYYYRPQELRAPAGAIELHAGVSLTEGVPLKSAPAGAFMITVPAGSKGGFDSTKGGGSAGARGSARSFRVSAGSAGARDEWIATIRAAIGELGGVPPPPEQLEQLVMLSGSVTASGGSSFAVRVQKHLAAQHASDDDLEGVLSKSAGLLPALRAMQDAHEAVNGPKARAEINKQCCVLAAKAHVLLRTGLLAADALDPPAAALEHALSLALDKEKCVRPRGPGAPRLLPGAVAVDASDPFHMELASAVRSIGSTLGAALGPQLSESSVQMFHEVFGALGSPEVLTTLFGNALKPSAGIASARVLNALIAAAEQRA